MGEVMKRGTITAGALATAAAAVVLAVGPAPAKEGSERGAEPESFAFGIGNHTLDGPPAEVGARYDEFDLVIVDGEEASAAEVTAMADADTLVLAYLSAGTIEGWRGWYDDVKRYRLKAWQDWKDEWFADTSRPAFRNKLTAIAEDEILAKGFDGLFLDNTDMVEAKRHRAQRAGMGRLIEMLDEAAGSERTLFTQNGAPGMLEGYPNQDVEPLIDHFQGWNREDVTWTYDFDRRRYVRNPRAEREDALDELAEIRAEGLVTSATDYVELDDGISEAECKATQNAQGVDALSYLGDIGLTLKAVEANPPDC